MKKEDFWLEKEGLEGKKFKEVFNLKREVFEEELERRLEERRT